MQSDQTDRAIDGGNALGDADVQTVHYWLCAAGQGAHMWEDFHDRGVIGIGWPQLGDLRSYSNREEMRAKLREVFPDSPSSFRDVSLCLWQFVHELKPGDVIFAKRGHYGIVGRGIVRGDYEFDNSKNDGYPNIRKVEWTHTCDKETDEGNPTKTLTDITNYTGKVRNIASLFGTDDGDDDDEDTPEIDYPAYTEDDFLQQVYISREAYGTLTGLLHTKKNIILQGAPGVGKTYLAKRLAYSMMGVKDISRVMMIQFHQSYSYEDFIMGFRPSEKGFELKKGVFYNFCKRAEDDGDNDYFFIIDEINRGNLSKIFGELFMLLESDKRGEYNKLQLLYSDELFFVPENVYIIGMMNTADRSLALLDYALRRRFAFFDLRPGFSSEGFTKYRTSLNSPKFDALIRCVEELNGAIAEDESLGEGFCVGHSYFCGITPGELSDERLSGIVEYEIIPLLREYWFDDPRKVEEWSGRLRDALKW
ncbi:MAG: AAA family ATPase [Synergistaceae bacterium]|nr:AAA family ATPase [Synergistaceae bacterium]